MVLLCHSVAYFSDWNCGTQTDLALDQVLDHRQLRHSSGLILTPPTIQTWLLLHVGLRILGGWHLRSQLLNFVLRLITLQSSSTAEAWLQRLYVWGLSFLWPAQVAADMWQFAWCWKSYWCRRISFCWTGGSWASLIVHLVRASGYLISTETGSAASAEYTRSQASFHLWPGPFSYCWLRSLLLLDSGQSFNPDWFSPTSKLAKTEVDGSWLCCLGTWACSNKALPWNSDCCVWDKPARPPLPHPPILLAPEASIHLVHQTASRTS